jgi:hypothetical protein
VITSASPEWVLLSAVYHHVFALSPSPEAAKIAIATARKNKQLRLRCTLRELKAQPGLRLAPGEKASPSPTVITQDYSIPLDTAFNHFDLERNYGTRHDSVTKSLFEYIEIAANRDDVLALWPGLSPAAASTPAESELIDQPRSEFRVVPPDAQLRAGQQRLEASAAPPRFVLPATKPHKISDTVWAVMRALVAVRNELDPAIYNLLNQEELVQAVNDRLRAATAEFGESRQVELRTLQTAVAELRRQLRD